MILQPPMELGRPTGAQKDPREAPGPDRTLDAWNSLLKHFPSEENMVSHFSHLSLENDHPYCGPSVAFSMGIPAPPVTRNPHSELLLWQYPGNKIPETLRLLRLGGPRYTKTPIGEAMEL
uniref:Host cell factor C1 regulator 1 n=1 Tax=Vombatus ursinus TaxID=29139 RepID=A0A4X2JME5_VOMUR